MKLSIIMPAFNEKRTLREIVNRVLSVDLPGPATQVIEAVQDFKEAS